MAGICCHVFLHPRVLLLCVRQLHRFLLRYALPPTGLDPVGGPCAFLGRAVSAED